MFKPFFHVSTSNASTNDTAKAQKRMEMNEKNDFITLLLPYDEAQSHFFTERAQPVVK